MNETLGANNTQPVQPVSEKLEVQQGAQASEVRTKRVIIAVMAALFIGGMAVLFKGPSESPVEQQEATQVAPVPATPQPSPAPAPKGKDFGL